MKSSLTPPHGFMAVIRGMSVCLFAAVATFSTFSSFPLQLWAQSHVPALRLAKTIELAGIQGKFDHFAIDLSGSRLFIAATGNHSVEVIDLKTDKVQQSITGLGKPHGLAWIAATGRLYVSDGALAELRVYQGDPLALAGTIKLSEDADDMVFDDAGSLLFVGHGGADAANPASIAVVDTEHFVLLKNLPVATHPEALEIDPKSRRVFANIADSNLVAVIDSGSKTVTTQWKLTKAGGNVPIAFDEGHRLVYVACRTPGTLLALDARTGAEIASQTAAGKADDLFYDSSLKRVYMISGVGEVDTFQVDERRALSPLEVLPTVPGAKTALFVPSQNLLYLGVPATGEHPAEIRAYATSALGAKP